MLFVKKNFLVVKIFLLNKNETNDVNVVNEVVSLRGA
nr:MAG TPA: hypothetical protein [Caudoviricetes sp.]